MDYSLHYDINFLKRYKGFYIEHTFVDHHIGSYRCPYMMLVYIAHGKGYHYIENKHNEVNEGDIVLINPNTPNCFYSSIPGRGLSVYCCSFFTEILPYQFTHYKSDFPELDLFFNGSMPHIQVMDTDQRDIRNLMIRMMDDFTFSQPGYEYTIKSMLTVALVNTFRIYTASQNHKNALNSNTVVGHINNYVNKNIHSKISLNEVAGILHLTPQYLCRAFKKHTNMTFTQFVNQIRVKKIKDELEHTDRPVYLIYNDFDLTPQYINRMFKKQTGYSLPDYKKKFNYKVNNPLYKMEEPHKINPAP